MKHYEEKVLLREFLSAPPVFLMHSQTFSKHLKWFCLFDWQLTNIRFRNSLYVVSNFEIQLRKKLQNLQILLKELLNLEIWFIYYISLVLFLNNI